MGQQVKKWIERSDTSSYFSNESKAGMEELKFKSIYNIINLFYTDLSKVILSTSLHYIKCTI